MGCVCCSTSATSSLTVRAPFLGDKLVFYVDSVILKLIESGAYVVDIVHGDVYSTRNGSLKKLKGQTVSNGYKRIHIRFKGERYSAAVHRIVWLARHREVIPEEMDIDHINDIRTDNRIRNLRMITKKENNWSNKLEEYYANKETDNRD